MIFHFGFELPEPVSAALDDDSPDLTREEFRILRIQVRKNAVVVDDYVARLDLLINKEKYPRAAVFIRKIRRRLELLMEENDTFRGVLWRHYQRQEIVRKTDGLK